MAKVYVFPTKKSLPYEVEDCLYEIGKAYIKTLQYALNELSGENPTNEELDGIKDLVVQSYAEGLIKAIDEIEEP